MLFFTINVLSLKEKAGQNWVWKYIYIVSFNTNVNQKMAHLMWVLTVYYIAKLSSTHAAIGTRTHILCSSPQAVVDGSAKRLVTLAKQWENHREPLIQQYRELRLLHSQREVR